MKTAPVTLTPEQQARLAHKGRLLYGKFCGTGGRGICAESFALHHLWRGEPEIALDLLAFLEDQIESLKVEDLADRLAMTQELAGRLRYHLDHEGEETPDPACRAAILKAKKQP